MKPEAFQVMIKERTGSPRLIENVREFNRAVREQIMKDIIPVGDPYNPNKFKRKTRMGGHLQSTLERAGLSNLGIV